MVPHIETLIVGWNIKKLFKIKIILKESVCGS